MRLPKVTLPAGFHQTGGEVVYSEFALLVVDGCVPQGAL